MRKSIRLQGLYVGSRRMFAEMNAALAAHQIHPVIHRTFPFDQQLKRERGDVFEFGTSRPGIELSKNRRRPYVTVGEGSTWHARCVMEGIRWGPTCETRHDPP
jgi:hypothetical protein